MADIPAASPMPRLVVVTDRRAVGSVETLLDRLARAAAGLPVGTMAVQVREKDLQARELLALVRKVREVLNPWNVPVLVNDRWDIAAAAGAEGVHLPESGLPPGEVRRVWSGRIGVSSHSFERLKWLADADFATFGPVFETPSKRAYGPPQGCDRLRRAVGDSPIPVLAIGGIDRQTAPMLRGTGITGIAVIRAVLEANDPAAAARELLELAGV